MSTALACLAKLHLFLFFFAFDTVAAEPGKIAMIQYDADVHFNQYETNKTNLTLWADRAVATSANIIIFPEGSMNGYADPVTSKKWCLNSGSKTCADVKTVAENIPEGKTTRYWAAYAKEHKVFILFNIPEVDKKNYYNSTGVVGPQGYVGKYRKRLLYMTDKYYAKPGSNEFFLSTPYGKFGLIICMDINSHFMDDYRKRGADAVIIQSDWDETPPEALNDYSAAAIRSNIDLYASDVSRFDGTGKYSPTLPQGTRQRLGLGEPAIGVDGFSIHELQY